jgi:hypothetical protein
MLYHEIWLFTGITRRVSGGDKCRYWSSGEVKRMAHMWEKNPDIQAAAGCTTD